MINPRKLKIFKTTVDGANPPESVQKQDSPPPQTPEAVEAPPAEVESAAEPTPAEPTPAEPTPAETPADVVTMEAPVRVKPPAPAPAIAAANVVTLDPPAEVDPLTRPARRGRAAAFMEVLGLVEPRASAPPEGAAARVTAEPADPPPLPPTSHDAVAEEPDTPESEAEPAQERIVKAARAAALLQALNDGAAKVEPAPAKPAAPGAGAAPAKPAATGAGAAGSPKPAAGGAAAAKAGPAEKAPTVSPAALEYSFGQEGLEGFLSSVQFILHVGDGAGAEYHVDLWYNVLKASGIPIIAAIRSRAVYDNVVKSRVDVRAVYVKSGREAEMVVAACANLKAIFYISNTGNVVHFARFDHVTHIWLGHGDSEKAASAHKFFRIYDEVWCAGTAQADRFRSSDVDYSSINFVTIGRPQSRWLLLARRAETKAHRFLYLPTWEGFQEGQNYSSVALAPAFLLAAHDITGDEPVIKLHPWTGNQNKTLAQAEKMISTELTKYEVSHQVVGRAQNVTDYMSDVDYLVADISSVITDFLPSQKPIFLYIPEDREIKLAASRMDFSHYTYIFKNLDEFVELTSRVIGEGDDYLAQARHEALNYFIGVKETVDHQIDKELLRLLAGGKPKGMKEPKVGRS